MKQGWESKRLSELFQVQSSKRVHKSDWKSKGVPFYRAREIVKLARDGFVKNDLFISEELFSEFTEHRGAPLRDDIVISAVGTLGKCYLVKEDDRFYIKDASVLWLSKNSEVDSRYIVYGFESKLIQDQVFEGSMGATVGTLTISRAKNILFPVPPLPEQKRIVAKLDQAFEAIDQAKTNVERNLQNAKDLFQSELNEIFSQKGDGWVEMTLEALSTDLITKGATPTTYGFPFVEDGIPFLRSECVSDDGFNPKGIRYISDDANEMMKRSIVKKGDILISITGNIGRITRYPAEMDDGNINQHIARVRVSEKIAVADFLVFQIKSDIIQKHYQDIYNGAAYPLLSLKQIRETMVSVPTVGMQKDLVAKLDNFLFHSKVLQSNYKQELEALDELKKSILQKAFNGEL